jgi:hypothetical protein
MTMKPASAARASRSCLLTISIRSGALNIRDKRWGRSGMLSPLHAIVPYAFVMRDALKTVWSILTALLSKRAAIALSADSSNTRDSSSFGRSIL